MCYIGFIGTLVLLLVVVNWCDIVVAMNLYSEDEIRGNTVVKGGGSLCKIVYHKQSFYLQ